MGTVVYTYTDNAALTKPIENVLKKLPEGQINIFLDVTNSVIMNFLLLQTTFLQLYIQVTDYNL